MKTKDYGPFFGHSMRTILGLLLPLSLWACASPTPSIIQDLQVLPQDTLFYLDGSASEAILPADRHALLDEELNRRYFAPWHREHPTFTLSDMEKELREFHERPGFGENKQMHAPDWIRCMSARVGLETYPNAGYPAVTVVNSDLRLLPTHKPRFDSADGAGTGYPFDTLQNSAIHANTPVFVTHRSADKSWVFVESHTGLGWLPTRDVARVDRAFTSQWEQCRMAAVLEDESPVYDEKGQFLFEANVGALFPLLGEGPDAYRILAAAPDEDRNARACPSSLPKERAGVKPLPLTRRNIATVARVFISKPYGWGGIYHNRDCSSTLKDLFTPFGVWLPRHSSNQALEGGRFLSLSGLDPAARERTIVRDGVPYFTLVWVKGHIMLYLGSYQGQPLVLHSMWGVRTRRPLGGRGRQIIGRTAVTTLHPGTELWDFDWSGGDMLDKLEGMTLLGTPPLPPDSTPPPM